MMNLVNLSTIWPQLGLFQSSQLGQFQSSKLGLFQSSKLGLFQSSQLGLFQSSQLGLELTFPAKDSATQRLDLGTELQLFSSPSDPDPHDYFHTDPVKLYRGQLRQFEPISF